MSPRNALSAAVVALCGCVDLDLDLDESPSGSTASSPATVAVDCSVAEVGDGLDNNCNGLVDEPMLDYRPDRPPQSRTYPQLPLLHLRIVDAAQVSYLDDGGCPFGGNYAACLADDATDVDYCKQVVLGCVPATQVKVVLTYEALSQVSEGNASVTPKIVVDLAANWRRGKEPILVVDPNGSARDFAPLEVYRVTAQLYRADGTSLGAPSDWFYSVTAGTTATPLTTLKWGRVDIALRAFDELGDFEDGLVGAGGTVAVDGSRYTLPTSTGGWCDDFVRYVGIRATDELDGNIAADPVVDGGTAFWNTMDGSHVPNAFRDTLYDGCGTWVIDPGPLEPGGTKGGVIDHGCQKLSSVAVAIDTKDNQFFARFLPDIYYDATRSAPENQGVGNFQSMDLHAGIFLAFDPSGDGHDGGGGTGTIWSIEGNVANDQIRIVPRPVDSAVVNGYGKLTDAMFMP